VSDNLVLLGPLDAGKGMQAKRLAAEPELIFSWHGTSGERAQLAIQPVLAEARATGADR
jgi:hypothetical protein